MKVRPKAGSEEGWLDSGTTYTVLGISLSGGEVSFRIYSTDQNTPALFSASGFDVVGSVVSARWVVEVLDHGRSLAIEPQAWTAPGFWEAYFDDDPDAVGTFAREYEALIAESVAQDA